VLFSDLFGSGVTTTTTQTGPNPEDLVRASVLDAVLEDAKALRLRLGLSDQKRLDQHLDAIRSLETRLKTLPPPTTNACMQPTAPEDTSTIRARVKAFSDIVAMAFACDLTRVVSFQFSSPASHVQYPDIGISDDIHEHSHVYGVDDMVNNAHKFFVEQMSVFLQTLKATAEGTGNLLDGSAVFGTSCTAYGPSHGIGNHPLLVAGKAGGALRYPGVHINANGDSATRVPFTLLKAFGLPQASFGSGPRYVDTPLQGILA
jgi:hypothetical protein